MRVLVVEDNPDGQEAYCLLLRAMGHEPDYAGNGHGGLARMAVQTPDAVILDYCMPGMDGGAFLREMRANPAWRRIPVAVVTALAGEDYDRTREAMDGALGPGFLARKPSESPDVIARLEQMAAGGRAET